MGSRAAVSAPLHELSAASTAVESGALVSTPTLDRAAMWVTAPSCRLSLSPPTMQVATPDTEKAVVEQGSIRVASLVADDLASLSSDGCRSPLMDAHPLVQCDDGIIVQAGTMDLEGSRAGQDAGALQSVGYELPV